MRHHFRYCNFQMQRWCLSSNQITYYKQNTIREDQWKNSFHWDDTTPWFMKYIYWTFLLGGRWGLGRAYNGYVRSRSKMYKLYIYKLKRGGGFEIKGNSGVIVTQLIRNNGQDKGKWRITIEGLKNLLIWLEKSLPPESGGIMGGEVSNMLSYQILGVKRALKYQEKFFAKAY